jgi:hypothetical protein
MLKSTVKEHLKLLGENAMELEVSFLRIASEAVELFHKVIIKMLYETKLHGTMKPSTITAFKKVRDCCSYLGTPGYLQHTIVETNYSK